MYRRQTFPVEAGGFKRSRRRCTSSATACLGDRPDVRKRQSPELRLPSNYHRHLVQLCRPCRRSALRTDLPFALEPLRCWHRGEATNCPLMPPSAMISGGRLSLSPSNNVFRRRSAAIRLSSMIPALVYPQASRRALSAPRRAATISAKLSLVIGCSATARDPVFCGRSGSFRCMWQNMIGSRMRRPEGEATARLRSTEQRTATRGTESYQARSGSLGGAMMVTRSIVVRSQHVES